MAAGGEAHRQDQTETVKVRGTVNGVSCYMTVDTGAERTILRPELIKGEELGNELRQLCGVTGHCMPLRGPINVTVGLGVKQFIWPVYVSEVQDQFLLGLDLLRATGALVDFNRGTLRMCGEDLPLIYTDTLPDVVVASRVTLPPCSETRVPCQLSGMMKGSTGMLEASELTDDVMVARSLLVKGKDPMVLMANFSNKERTIHAGTKIGVCEEVVVQGMRREGGCVSAPGSPVPAHLTDLAKRSGKNLNADQKEEMENLLRRYAGVFSKNDSDLGRTNLVKHHIHTGDAAPIKQTPRRISPIKREEIKREVLALNKQGVIEPSESPWSSAVVLVRKPDGSRRLCIDYRQLNDVTTKDSYPLPRVDDTLDALTGARWFSTLDLKSGFYQVEMNEKDKEKTAFACGLGLWHFRVMPFGLANAPSCFERLMEKVLEGLHWKTALIYLDDVIVYGKSFEEELKRLEEVLQRFQNANLKLSPKKCLLFQQEVPYLGHIVGKDGVRTDPTKVAAVREWPTPSNLHELRSFLGLSTYYRRFIKAFSQIAAPLHNLTKKGVRFEWTQECEKAFCELKQALIEAPVLPYPDPTIPYLLDTDASHEGLGAVLSQVKDGKERVVAYYSSKLTGPEKNYCVTRKELLAVVKSLEHFHPYLYGAKFTIRTDHAALKWLKTLKAPEGQLARWLGRLEGYNYEVVYRPGRIHANADSLSRRPCESECSHCKKKDTQVECKRLLLAEDEETINDRLKEAQQRDEDISPIIRWLQDSPEKPDRQEVAAESPVTKHLWQQWQLLRLEDGVLQRRWVNANGNGSYWVLVVPRVLRQELMEEMHGGVTSGHQGEKKTLSRLRKRFYWVNMRHDVTEWCRACSVCRSRLGPQRQGRAPLQLYLAGSPMERVGVDITGPFPVTASGNRFVLVAMDYFTKWPEAYAIPNHEATTVARALVDGFFTRFGMPKELHSDQGREFESKVFQETCRLLGIKKTRTTPLRPQSAGLVERFNKTLTQGLAKYCSSNQRDWDEHLSTLLMAYRSAVHEATAYTPAELMLGRDMRLPVDLATGRPPGDDSTHLNLPFSQSLQNRLAKAHTHARQWLRTAGYEMKARYDMRTEDPVYKVGDLVWLYNPRRKKGLSPKLQSPWEGPWEVVEKLTDVTYRIRRGARQRSRVVHSDRLWAYHGRGSYTWDEGDGPPDIAGQDDEGDGPPDLAGQEDDGDSPPGVAGREDGGDSPSSQTSWDGDEDEESGDATEGGETPSQPDQGHRREASHPRRRRRRPAWTQDYIFY